MTPRSLDVLTAAGFVRTSWRGGFLGAISLFAILIPAVAAAQSAAGDARPTSPVPVTPVPAGRAADENRPAAGEPQPVFGLVKAEDGLLIPLPPGTSYADFLEWLAARRGPGFGINSVEVTGHVDDDERIELDARVVVVVSHDEAVRVPLAFNEAVLLNVEHEGVGEFSYQPFSKETGHVWSLRGRGEHQLSLKLLVPLSAGSGETRLALTTPANAATTKFDLEVPPGSEVAAGGGIVRSERAADGGTAVEWIGTGGRLDLSWRPKPADADPADLTAVTTIFPSVSGKSLQLRAVQRVTATKGRVSTVRVRLPVGYSLIDVVGPLYGSHAEEPTDAGRVVAVQLKEPTEGTIELTWRVSAPLAGDGSADISGFALESVPADAQSGRIVIERSGGYEITAAGRSDGVDVMEMVEPGPLVDSAAFTFEAQPFELRLKVEAIAPSLSVRPDLVLQVRPDGLDLDAKFGVEVRRGEVREMRLVWPAPAWKVTPVRAGSVQEFRRAPDDAPPVEISVPASVASFVIPVRATRELPMGPEAIDVPLPRIEPAAPKASIDQDDAAICFRHPKNFAVEVLSSDGRPLAPLDAARAPALPEVGEDERWTLHAAPPGIERISVKIRRLRQEVDATAEVSVRQRGEKLRVEQRIDYHIRHEPLSELRLLVPAALLRQELDFSVASGRLAKTVGEAKAGVAEVVLDLGRAVIGPISVSTGFDLPYPADPGATGEASIPIVVPEQVPLDSAVLRVSDLERHSMTLAGTGWVPFQTTENDRERRWIAAEPSREISFRLVPRAETDDSGYQVSKLLLRTVVKRDGSVHTVADWRLEAPPELLAIRLPPGVADAQFQWRGREVGAEIISDDAGRLAEVTLGRRSGPGVLTVSYHSPGDGPLGLAVSRTFDAPRLPDRVRIEETLWWVTLPESQHLFTGPRGYDSRFRWGLHGALWTRRNDETVQEVSQWFGDGASDGPELGVGHRYAFSRTGAAVPLGFTGVSRSLVVLLGAGAAIALGYMFVNGLIPRRRSVLIGIGAALLAVWAFFPNQLQIFLQPAVFGLALVILAAFAEWILRKRQERIASPSASSAVEFVTILPGDGSTSEPQAAIGSEEPTVLRTARPAEPVGSTHGHPAAP